MNSKKSTQKKLTTSKYLYIFALILALGFLFLAFDFLSNRQKNLSTQHVLSSSKNFEFDFTTLEGKKKAVETYIMLHNQLGRMKWLPFDMDFGYSRGWSIARHAVEGVFFPLIKEKNLVKGPTCLDWSTRYIGGAFKDICTDPYPIYYEKNYCGGQFGKFTEGRKGFCADIHQTQGVIPDNMFDMVLSTMVFEHLTNPWVATQNVYNIIKPGGVFVFIAPQISIFHEFPNHYYGFTVQGAVLMMQQAGFCVKYAHGITSSFGCVSHIMGFATKDFFHD
eukprot:TRINITY_DN71668_c0_g1_i2.p1 TRINITY_DN71668_c0_g1~~TRINITY_DN71668_c0_g1_i2.p1  ORF type:complete len:278 (-),score=24.86 TRINITY_DN71668_c0_g1_i2:30-863(-)